jgi:hypothetical protein
MENTDKDSRPKEKERSVNGASDEQKNRWIKKRGWIISKKIAGVIVAAILAIASAWIVAAKTAEPRIPLSAASEYFVRFYQQVADDPAKTRMVWNTMTTETYRDYSSLRYPKFAEFWSKEKQPSILDVSKDGSNTFAVSLIFHSKNGEDGAKLRKFDFAAVLVCDDRQARWTFSDCGSESLLLEDSKNYDLRVLEG